MYYPKKEASISHRDFSYILYCYLNFVTSIFPAYELHRDRLMIRSHGIALRSPVPQIPAEVYTLFRFVVDCSPGIITGSQNLF